MEQAYVSEGTSIDKVRAICCCYCCCCVCVWDRLGQVVAESKSHAVPCIACILDPTLSWILLAFHPCVFRMYTI
jgi:hypothetical protein